MTVRNTIASYVMTTFALKVVVASVYLFLYTPILLLIVFSFNGNTFAQDWDGFTFTWYQQLFASQEMWDALYTSFMVALLTVFLSVSMATAFVFFSTRWYARRIMLLFYASLAMPEIVLAVAMLSFFSLMHVPLGFTTLVAGHTLLGLGYAVPILYARYNDIDRTLIEAAHDLGATEAQTFFTIIVPLLRPALIAASLLVFIVSLDDFVISFFCMSAAVQTLPIYIFSLIRAGATPMVNALSTLMIISSVLVMILFSLFHSNRFEVHE